MTLILESPHFINALTCLHLLGLCIGFGGALFADVFGLRLLFASNEMATDEIIQQLPKFIGLGIALLWVTGLVISYVKLAPTGFALEKIPTEYIAKFILLGFLTLNAFLIRRRLTKLTLSWRAPRVFNMGLLNLVQTVGLACLPFAAWAFTLMIVQFPTLQRVPLQGIFTLAGIFWVACAVGAIGAILLIQSAIAARAAMNGRSMMRANQTAGRIARNSDGRGRRNPRIAPPVRTAEDDFDSFDQGWNQSPDGYDNGYMDEEPHPSYGRQPSLDRNALPQRNADEGTGGSYVRSEEPDELQWGPRPVNSDPAHDEYVPSKLISRLRNGPRLNDATQLANRNTNSAEIDYMDDYRTKPTRNGALLHAITQVPLSSERKVKPRGANRWWEGA